MGKWSEKYKKSIDCNHPKGFSQKAHCQGRKKKSKLSPTKKKSKTYFEKYDLYNEELENFEYPFKIKENVIKKLEDILAEECLRGTFGQDYMSTGGSKPLTVRVQERALHIVTKKIKDQLKSSKSISVTTTKLPKEETSKGYTGTAKIAGKAVSKKQTKVARKGYPRVAKAQKTAKSPIALLALINQALPNTLVKNMGAPRLVNRTGRFAQSVRAIDISTTRGGYPSIGYTYEKDPYQVFESTSGTRFSSRERDPRVLIDQSIREIAATLMVGRLYTRRV